MESELDSNSLTSDVKFINILSVNKKPFINISCNSRRYRAVVDTGADVSVVNVKIIDPSSVLSSSSTVLKGADGSLLNCLGKIELPIVFKERILKHSFFVLSDLSSDFLLGNDILGSLGIRLNISLVNEESVVSDIVAFCTAKVEPFSSRVVKSVLEGPLDSPVIEVSGCEESLLYIKEGVYNNLNNFVNLIVTNNTPDVLYIKKKDPLGRATSFAGDTHQISTICGEVVDDTPAKISDESIDRIVSSTDLEVRRHFKCSIKRFTNVFTDTGDVGKSSVVPHFFEVKDKSVVVCEAIRRIPENLKPIVTEYVNKLLDMGIIKKSNSPFNSPLMLVKKKGFDPSEKDIFRNWRCVHDLRRLNEIISNSSYPMKNVQELIDQVSSKSIFSVIDISSGFWNQMLDEKCKKYTAFSVPNIDTFQYTRTMQGLKTSPAEFQKMVDFILDGVKNVFTYMDDIIIASDNNFSHLKSLEEVFLRLEKYNIKLKLSKLQLAKRKIEYLGFTIEKGRIKAGLIKTEVIRNYKPPTSVKEVKQFLGLCNYFRRTIPNFAVMASPLNKLLRKNSVWTSGPLNKEALDAFESLKTALISRPCLHGPDFGSTFFVITDASTKLGLGAILAQKNSDNVFHPISYASRSLSDAEKSYSAYRLEKLAILWSMRQYAPYLRGKEFVVLTIN